MFVRTGSEEKVVRILKNILNTEEYLPFIPIKESHHRNKGVVTKDRKIMFPGYVFIQTTINPTLISETLALKLQIVSNKNVYSLLHYGDDKNDVVVHENEHHHLESMLDDEFCITGSTGFIEGDMVRITSGALVGMESKIKKINRHKREAIIELEMMGAVREVRLMLEIVLKI